MTNGGYMLIGFLLGLLVGVVGAVVVVMIAIKKQEGQIHDR